MGKRRFAGTVRGPDQTPNNRFHSQGMDGHIRGWDTGVRVTAYLNDEGEEEFDIYVTSGSNGGERDKFIGKLVGSEWFSETVEV